MAKRSVTPHEHAEAIVKRVRELKGADEADTRFQIIDEIITKVLGWPRILIKCESFIDPGFADYVLSDRRSRQVLFIYPVRSNLRLYQYCRF